jgi:hypothetical protein
MEVVVPTWTSKRSRGNPGPPQDIPVPAADVQASVKPADLLFMCKFLQPGIPEDAQGKAQLKANLEKMGCSGLMGFQWGHEEKNWLKEVYSQDTSAFPNTVRENPDS